ncbi:NADP-dependent oxidoreductase domain-containing protein [Mycena rosella]|uniref:NADP-dependent oxidoreductase domain-containing protein n=1 Tax=Mycena rosella TaxID=1033263 RepID=A0AAD7DZA0_MYCRO|nr:NADP-dependent oxidoreductase domain-containing protein [Mycena rosella]
MTCPGSPPILIFGGALIGHAYNTTESVSELLAALKSLGIRRIDTAARYPPTNPGNSERLLGQTGAAAQGFTIDTKFDFSGDGSGSLEPAAVDKSLNESYERLALEKDVHVNVFYCHTPDPKTPLEAQAAGLDAQYKKGLFTQLGVSNFSPEMLSSFIEICEREGFVKPTVYQGQYNLVCRGSEDTLFPMLRRHGISINAYSPLAGGFLTGQLTAGTTEGTRFADGNLMGQSFKAQYDKAEMHAAINDLGNIIRAQGISSIEASLRWVCFHSALHPEDGVILGASSTAQLAQNVAWIEKGALPEKVIAAMDVISRQVSGKGA